MDAAAQVLDWQNAFMSSCFTLALESAKADSPSYYVLSFAILLTFHSLFVAKLIAHKFAFASQVLEKVGIIVASFVFVLATTIPFPLWFKCAAWAFYAASLFSIVICNFI